MKHTKEPWFVVLSDNATPFIMHEGGRDWTDIDDESSIVCWMPAELTVDYNSLNNAERIVACVNALTGVPTELIKRGEFAAVEELASLREQLAEAKREAQRIRAFIAQIGIVGQVDGHDVIRRESAIEMIDRAVATREGE